MLKKQITDKIIKKTLVMSTVPLFLYCSPMTHAGGGEVECSPNSSILNNQYDSCNNLPILDPANDNQTNMLLLLSDLGLATIKTIPPETNVWDAVEGTSPLMLVHSYLKPAIKSPISAFRLNH